MSDKPEVTLNHFTYPELVIGRHAYSCLPNDKRAFACWYFYTIAEKSRQMIGKGDLGQGEAQFGLLDDFLWMDKRYVDQAKSVARLYQLESPNEFAKFWDCVRRQALALDYPEPHPEYTRLSPRQIIH